MKPRNQALIAVTNSEHEKEITSSDSIQDIDKVSIILSVNLLKLDDFERKSFNDWRTEEVISIIMDICRCERMGSSM